jgi:hypothetical protein
MRRFVAVWLAMVLVLTVSPAFAQEVAPVEEPVDEIGLDPVEEDLPPVVEDPLKGHVEGALEDPAPRNHELDRPGWRASSVDAIAPVDGGAVELAGVPIELEVPKEALGADASVRAEVLDPTLARSVSPFGAALELDFEVAGEAKAPAAPYDVVVDFNDVRLSQHGFAASRLQLVWMTGCSEVKVEATDEIPEGTTRIECEAQVPVPAEFDLVNRVVKATIDEQALAKEAGVVLDVAVPAEVGEITDSETPTTTLPEPSTTTTTTLPQSTTTTVPAETTTTLPAETTSTTVVDDSTTTTTPGEDSTTTSTRSLAGSLAGRLY